MDGMSIFRDSHSYWHNVDEKGEPFMCHMVPGLLTVKIIHAFFKSQIYLDRVNRKNWSATWPIK
jgi:hypothetical protein